MSKWTIDQVIGAIRDGEIAKARFTNESWYITKSNGFIRYCNEDGSRIGEVVSLTYSSLKAWYDLKQNKK